MSSPETRKGDLGSRLRRSALALFWAALAFVPTALACFGIVILVGSIGRQTGDTNTAAFGLMYIVVGGLFAAPLWAIAISTFKGRDTST